MTINLIENRKQKIESKGNGFSLVETLVALSILLIAVVNSISLIGDSLHKIYYAKDEMVAINLAQEGIETVRQVRDSNMLSAVAWDKDISVGYYTIDAGNIGGASNTFVKSCAACTTPQPVYLEPALGGLYWQTIVAGYSNTQFSRIVRIESIVANQENKITSTVTWKTGGDTGTVSNSENIFKLAP